MVRKGFRPAAFTILVAGAIALTAAVVGAQTFLFKWGTTGTADGQLIGPEGLAIDAGGNVYVAEFGGHRVQKFTGAGSFVFKFGSNGTGDGLFGNPADVALDSAGNIYVADWANERVQKFTNAGVFLGWLGKCTAGPNCDAGNQRSMGFGCTAATCSGLSAGTGDGQFDTPRSIAVDSFDNVYVGEQGGNRVQKFSASGAFLTKWGSQGSGAGQFEGAQGVLASPDGRIYVADGGNRRVQIFDSSGGLLGVFATRGFPGHMGIDSAGCIYVPGFDESPLIAEVEVFTANGSLVGSFGSPGSGNGQFTFPRGAAVAPNGDVYVTDASADDIHVFSASPCLEDEGGEPRREGRNVGGAAGVIVGAISEAAERNRERSAGPEPTGVVAPPRTGTGVTPPSTGDGGLIAGAFGARTGYVLPIAALVFVATVVLAPVVRGSRKG
jgi:DNA-binding beta-propeller fold protein YncE